MSSVRPLPLILLLLAPGSRLPAQDQESWRDSVARLGSAVQALTDSLRTGDSTVVEVTRRGGTVLRASRDLQAAGAGAFDRFLAARQHWFGAALPSPGGFRILLRDYGDYGRPGPSRLPQTLELSGLPDRDDATRTFRGARQQVIGDPDSAAALLLFEYGKLMLATASPALVKWLAHPLPFELGEPERKLAAMYALVTGPGKAQRACVAGSLADCGYALGLGPAVSAEPGGGYVEFLRGDFLLSAIEMGGPDSWNRLRASTAPRIADQITELAGLPLDSLLAGWRHGLLAMRPQERPLTPGQAIVTALWGIILMAAAVGASRWV